jgi:uncharacterized protein (DUF1501 family)
LGVDWRGQTSILTRGLIVPSSNLNATGRPIAAARRFHVTTFTASDFNRTFQPTSGDGTDHAWGGHHLVLGGAVHGGQIYGQFPTFELGGPDDTDTRGRWIPTTSIDQYGATLCSWFGIPDSVMNSVFPNLPNFSNRNLGFVG